MWEDEDFRKVIIEEPEVWGIQEMTPDWITVRVTLKTAPLEQWGVAREMRERIKARFDHLGIELARPARVIIHRDHPSHRDSQHPDSQHPDSQHPDSQASSQPTSTGS